MHFSGLFALLAIVPAALCAPPGPGHSSSVSHSIASTQSVQPTHPAPPPIRVLTGSIAVKTASNKFLGYLSFDTHSIHGFVPRKPKEVVVSFNPRSEPFALDIVRSGRPTKFYVGGAGFNPLKRASANIVPLDVVPLTPPFSGPVPPIGAESTIWSLDFGDNELTAQWVNRGGQKPQTFIAFDPKRNQLFFTGDIRAYNQKFRTKAELVRFFFVKK
ncbi:hypothetical protein OBBRIDRAFT_838368 [Obba rivulosa]|uniref:Uncharacterized protein n=1 Tax=Obba rivulosa TaxID=1052685 RepID=A0A8E2DKU3_9APHY|nr:hypothetical protein OBBRIDRAFT_838368 [Obba rivulosa]